MTKPLVLLMSAALAVGCGPTTSPDAGSGQQGPAAEVGDRLPDVDVVDLDSGVPVLLSDIAAPAVINLWATWCAPCRREIPDFESVHRSRGDEVTFVGVNVGDDADDARRFLDDVGATYAQFLDPEGYASTELNLTTMPVTVITDADGAISTRHLGPMSADDLENAIDRALDTG